MLMSMEDDYCTAPTIRSMEDDTAPTIRNLSLSLLLSIQDIGYDVFLRFRSLKYINDDDNGRLHTPTHNLSLSIHAMYRMYVIRMYMWCVCM